MEWDIWKKTLKLKLQEPSVPTCLTKISFGGIPNSRNVLLSFIPHIDLWGFCFLVLVSARSFRPPPFPLTHSITHSLTLSLITHSHSFTHSFTYSSLSFPLTHSITHTLTLTGVPLVPLGLRRFCVAGVAQPCIGKGSDVRPGVPLASLWCHLVSAAFAWQAWTNVALARGRMYALASLWRPSGAIGSPPLLRGRRGTTCIGKRSDVRPGVPVASVWSFRPPPSFLPSHSHSHSFTHSFTY